MRAVLRRTSGGGDTERTSLLTFADIELDEDSHEVRKAGQEVALSPTEFKLLRYFMLNPGRVLSKARSSTTCGSTTSAVKPESSSPTCLTSARRSTPVTLGCCTRCGEWGTSFACLEDELGGRLRHESGPEWTDDQASLAATRSQAPTASRDPCRGHARPRDPGSDRDRGGGFHPA